MRIELNGETREVSAERLDAALDELGYAGATVATALNGAFVPRAARARTTLREGDRVEVVAPLQGG
jgi:sulfur carrier protein